VSSSRVARALWRNVDQPLLAAVDERPEKAPADQREDGGVGADASASVRITVMASPCVRMSEWNATLKSLTIA